MKTPHCIAREALEVGQTAALLIDPRDRRGDMALLRILLGALVAIRDKREWIPPVVFGGS